MPLHSGLYLVSEFCSISNFLLFFFQCSLLYSCTWLYLDCSCKPMSPFYIVTSLYYYFFVSVSFFLCVLGNNSSFHRYSINNWNHFLITQILPDLYLQYFHELEFSLLPRSLRSFRFYPLFLLSFHCDVSLLQTGWRGYSHVEYKLRYWFVSLALARQSGGKASRLAMPR